MTTAKGGLLVRTGKLPVHWTFSAVLSHLVVSAKFVVSKVPGLEAQSLPKQNWVRLWEGEDCLDLHVI